MAKLYGHLSGSETLALLQKLTPDQLQHTNCEIRMWAPEAFAGILVKENMAKPEWDNDTGEWYCLTCEHGIFKGGVCDYCDEKNCKHGVPLKDRCFECDDADLL